jgi:hypothetical protein
MKQFLAVNKLSSLCLIIVAITTNAYADTTLHFKQKGSQNEDKSNSIYIKSGKIRFSESDAQNGEYSIFDSNNKKIIHISPTRRAYIEMDQNSVDKQMTAMKQQMDKMMAQMQEQMKNMPPEQRQMMEQMMAQGKNGQMPGMPQAPKQKQIKTAKTARVAGVKCSIVEIWVGSAIKEELCIADENQFAIDSADKKTISNMNKFIQNMSLKANSIMGGQPMVEQFDGVPIRTRHYSSIGKLINETGLSSISQNDVSEKKVSIPAGYVKQSISQEF